MMNHERSITKMKNYVKPELFYESYELSQNIAACGWDLNQANTKDCKFVGDPTYGNPSIVVFETKEKCETVLEGYCYENSSDNIAMKIFQS